MEHASASVWERLISPDGAVGRRPISWAWPAARQGDQCSCPLPGHGICKIVEGDPKVLISTAPDSGNG